MSTENQKYSLQDVVERFNDIKKDLNEREIEGLLQEAKEKEEKSSSEDDSYFCQLEEEEKVNNYIEFMGKLNDDQFYQLLDSLPMRKDENEQPESNIDKVLDKFSSEIESVISSEEEEEEEEE